LGPVRWYILYQRPSIFSLKIVPGGTLPSADYGAAYSNPAFELRGLNVELRNGSAG
jgi:hypothetical protein